MTKETGLGWGVWDRVFLCVCVLSYWLTPICALWIVLIGWLGPVLCKHMAWRHQKCLNFWKKILSYNTKNLFHSISEGAWKLPSYLLPIFCWFHVNNNDITIFMRRACERAWSIFVSRQWVLELAQKLFVNWCGSTKIPRSHLKMCSSSKDSLSILTKSCVR